MPEYALLDRHQAGMRKFKKYRLTGILFSVPGDNETLLNIRDYF